VFVAVAAFIDIARQTRTTITKTKANRAELNALKVRTQRPRRSRLGPVPAAGDMQQPDGDDAADRAQDRGTGLAEQGRVQDHAWPADPRDADQHQRRRDGEDEHVLHHVAGHQAPLANPVDRADEGDHQNYETTATHHRVADSHLGGPMGGAQAAPPRAIGHRCGNDRQTDGDRGRVERLGERGHPLAFRPPS
jgi:hypothetical protein